VLVLTRKWQEKVFILLPDGREVVITLVGTDGNKVRLGFECPRDLKIFLEELLPRPTTASEG
jgi:carbon storage regulator CsrA